MNFTHRITCNRLTASQRSVARQRRGSVLVLAAILMVAMVAMIAFAVDVGYIVLCRNQMQRATDSGALAGAGVLGADQSVTEQTAIEYVQKNYVSGAAIPTGDIQVELGQWDAQSRTFQVGGDPLTAVRVFAEQQDESLFFARVLGQTSFGAQAEAIATFQPRDIVVVLDYSASMNDDSELRHINKIGQANVEANLFEIYAELGSPTFGTMQWAPQYIATNNVASIKAQLGLTLAPYPFPSGSWDDYINYVKTSSYINAAGYKKKYGYLTLTNYWLERRPKYDQTPALWQTSEQPITAVKDSMTVFLDYLQIVEANDRVGLSIYTSDDGGGKLESGLTDDFQLIEDISRQRQAGHYDYFTNIGGGMQKARVELENNARPGALRMMVLMTDGKANRPNNPTTAKQFVLAEAQLAADAGLPIITISLGADADQALMQQVADITQGVHFNIPGGQSVSEYEEDLKDVFREIADRRPVQLVE